MTSQTTTTQTITLPKEDYAIIEYSQNHQVGMATINTAMKNFAHKAVFPWHLSVIILCEEINAEKMPTQDENALLLEFEGKIGERLQSNGNAVFIASNTRNGYRELVWRVHNPETSNEYLLGIIESEEHPRPFDFTLEEDKGWSRTEWHFNMLDKSPDYDMPGNHQSYVET